MAADRTRPWRRTTPAALITLTVAGVIAATTLGSSGLGARHRQPPHPAAERPAAPLTRRLTIGRSVEGRPIRAIRIGQAGDSRTLPIVGCIHGNEPAGIAIARHLATASTSSDRLDLGVGLSRRRGYPQLAGHSACRR